MARQIEGQKASFGATRVYHLEDEEVGGGRLGQGVLHPTWLDNPVVVRKANGKWRLCIDYTDINKACPKDPFPLPRIDQTVDSTAGCDLLSFLDAYSGYHQIFMTKEDEEKTAFITHVVRTVLYGCLSC